MIRINMDKIHVTNIFTFLNNYTQVSIQKVKVGIPALFLGICCLVLGISRGLRMKILLIKIIMFIERLCRTYLVLYIGHNLYFIIYTRIHSEKKFTFKKHCLSFAMMEN